MTANRTADDDRISVRRAEAIKLRMEGHTFREIAEIQGTSVSVAHVDVRKMLEEVGDEARDHAAAARGLELNRLDRFQREVNAVLETERNPELRMKAVDRGVRISERRSKLLGLDAPNKQEVTAALVDVREATPAMARAVMGEVFGSVGPDDDEAQAPDLERERPQLEESSVS